MNDNKSYVGCFVVLVLAMAIALTVFITLKLTGVIEWSWLWVLSPLWLPVLLFVFAIGLISVLVAVHNAITKK